MEIDVPSRKRFRPRYLSGVRPAPKILKFKRSFRKSAARRVAVGVETKYFDLDRSSAAISSSWAGGEIDPIADLCLFAPEQGSTVSERDGNKVVVRGIQIHGYVQRARTSDQADVHNNNLIQIALVMDKQTNGVQLNAEDVYSTISPEVPGTRVIENMNRFRVLKTWTVQLSDCNIMTDGVGTASISGECISFSCHLRCNYPVNFVSSPAPAGDVTDCKDVSFHLIACAEQNIAADTISYTSRIKFVG